MCPPVVLRKSREGVSYLHASWLYELQHGSQLRICFACFKFVFEEFKLTLESEDWQDEEWDSGDEGESEQEGSPGSGLGGGPAQGASAPPSAPSAPWAAGPEEDGSTGPAELTALGWEDWTQALPWTFITRTVCSHWPKPPPPQPVFPSVTLALLGPMVLELDTLWPVEPAEATACLLSLHVFCSIGCQDATMYMRKMSPRSALRCPGQRWRVLLEPVGVWAVKLLDAAQQCELLRCQLCIMERTQHGEQLLPAYTVLEKKGFTVLSYSPWWAEEEEDGDSASAAWPLA